MANFLKESIVGILPEGIPVYCGRATAELINMSAQINPEKMQPLKLQTFNAWETLQIGPFSVIPYLMDHSAFDAYGFLISAGGKSLFYTGDFRGHGRKAKLLDRLIKNPPKTNALLMEGTLVGERTNELTMYLRENQGTNFLKPAFFEKLYLSLSY